MENDIVTMKSILIITSFLPYPIHSGGEQAQFNMIEALKGNYKIGIVFPVNRDNRPEDVKALSNIWPEVRMFPFPWWKQYTYLPFLAQKARKFINRHLSSFWKKSKADDVISVNSEVKEIIAPLVYIVPLQLIAYYITLEKGHDPDKPKNLAKCVTVE